MLFSKLSTVTPIGKVSDDVEARRFSHSSDREGLKHGRGFARLLNNFRQLDLRFPSQDEEKAFTCSQKPQLQGWAVVACAFGLVVGVAVCLQTYIPEYKRQDNPMFTKFPDERLWHVVSMLTPILAMLAVSTMIICNRRLGVFGQTNWELLVTIWLNSCVLCVFFKAGEERKQIWVNSESLQSAEASEYRAALVAGSIITAACLILPIRTCYLWTFPCSVFGGYAAVFVQHQDTQAPSLPLVASLSILVVCGAWRIEKCIRKDLKLLNDVTSISQGMETVAEYLCDLVIKLSDEQCMLDVASLRASFLGPWLPASGSLRFVELLTESDAQRFENCLTLAAESKTPQRIAVTLACEGCNEMEMQLLVVTVNHRNVRFLIGLYLEQRVQAVAHPSADLGELASAWQPTCAKNLESESSFCLSEPSDVFEAGITAASSGLPLMSCTLDAVPIHCLTTVDSCVQVGPAQCGDVGVQTETFEDDVDLRAHAFLSGQQALVPRHRRNSHARRERSASPRSSPHERIERHDRHESSSPSSSSFSAWRDHTSEAAPPPLDGAGEEHQFDGVWIALNPPRNMQEWMKRLVILGRRVQENDGMALQLTRDTEDTWLYRGSRIWIALGMLHRARTSDGEVCQWRRVIDDESSISEHPDARSSAMQNLSQIYRDGADQSQIYEDSEHATLSDNRVEGSASPSDDFIDHTSEHATG